MLKIFVAVFFIVEMHCHQFVEVLTMFFNRSMLLELSFYLC
uniref:Uncharacterized protein n=1 Tax=Setaria viridis TaxID=4556 RepID=A0A4U6VD71_SETVI|nr:hypothetical protein SEVIR_3G144750v2 [Setaria viridis]